MQISKMSIRKKKVNESWTRAETLFLISKLKLHPVLYSLTDPHYRNVHKRYEAIEQIKLELQTIKDGITTDGIKMKLRTLKNQVLTEKKRAREMKNSTRKCDADDDDNVDDDDNNDGDGDGKTYKPKLWCYNQLQFYFKNTNDDDDDDNDDNDDDDDANDCHDDISLVINDPMLNLSYDCSSATSAPAEEQTESDDEKICPSKIKKRRSRNTQTEILTETATKSLQYLEMLVSATAAANGGVVGGGFGGCNAGCSAKPSSHPLNPTKEEAFCNFLCTELQQLRCEEIFDRGKIEILQLVTRLKEEDRRFYSLNQQLEQAKQQSSYKLSPRSYRGENSNEFIDNISIVPNGSHVITNVSSIKKYS